MTCALCGRDFKRIQALRAHERIVHQVQPDGSARMAATALREVEGIYTVLRELIEAVKRVREDSKERDVLLSKRLDAGQAMDKKLMRCVLDLKEMVEERREAVQPE